MKLLKFFEFIFESTSKSLTVPFVMSPDFMTLLSEVESPVQSALLKHLFEPSDVSLITFGNNSDSVKFTTALKISEILKSTDVGQLKTLVRPLSRHETEIYHKNSTDIRVGRFIRKVFGNNFSDVQIEDFVNKYKSLRENRQLQFDLWDNYQIVDGYKSQNFTFENGSSNALMNSCMNDQLEFIQFYRYVPVKLLVLTNSEGHIFGRSLIWRTNKGYFMDRVYTAFESDYHKFVDWAKSNRVIYKAENKSGAKIEYVKDGNISWFPMKVDLNFDVEVYEKDSHSDRPQNFPYLDTFCYGQGKLLTNYEPVNGNFLLFQDTDGEYLEVIIRYDIFGNRIDMSEIDDYVYSETQKGWIHFSDCTYIKSESDYLTYDYLQDPRNGFTYDLQKDTYTRISK